MKKIEKNYIDNKGRRIEIQSTENGITAIHDEKEVGRMVFKWIEYIGRQALLIDYELVKYYRSSNIDVEMTRAAEINYKDFVISSDVKLGRNSITWPKKQKLTKYRHLMYT
jgi:hypothetical protein